MDGKPVSESPAQLVRWMGLSDANTAGNVHGGTVMRLCDEAVALDDDGRPTEIPPVIPETHDERRRRREADMRRANRLAEREQILSERKPDQETLI